MSNKSDKEKVAVVILAAGKGSRMRSDKPKVLHELAGAPLIKYILATAETLKPETIVSVIAPSMKESVGAAVAPHPFVFQKEQKGTGHAVLMAKEVLKDFQGKVLIIFGDVPLIRSATLKAMLEAMEKTEGQTGVLLLGTRPSDPTGYGRIIQSQSGEVEAIVEHLDCTDEQKKIDLIWSGLMIVDGAYLFQWLEKIGSDNAQGEIYLTSIVEIARRDGKQTHVVECDPLQVQGINSKSELARMEYTVQQFLRTAHLDAGVTMIDPETVTFSIDTKIAADCVIEPYVFFGRGVEIDSSTRIKAFSHIEETKIGKECTIGPFARLRPQTDIQDGAKIGNFVEVKKAIVEKGAKINHLSYIGDAHIGEKANIGAGTITCNYDGFFKYQTKIGKEAFIGSNTALVAPVEIGDGAMVGAGSTITKNVEAGDLSVARGVQKTVTGWATKFRKKMSEMKQEKKKAS